MRGTLKIPEQLYKGLVESEYLLASGKCQVAIQHIQIDEVVELVLLTKGLDVVVQGTSRQVELLATVVPCDVL